MKPELTHFDRQQDLEETKEDLLQDVQLLRLALRGAEGAIDRLTLDCLLRLTDYLEQHTADLCRLSGRG